eukprot:CAMPEP_0113895858 /NCGR_PEP_ID=MMETSP0780_2-20120614/17635_1 /TAXON_ID=652834 /ORGANISM="Palpitomonas bilix" /LENGTH=125 /DNA_ID=CAMNT_0000886813 /DNA_START=468 /DNA_END=842 /DNA_ORIENTATION=- /assembly_acc=CAM_ASM_000599
MHVPFSHWHMLLPSSILPPSMPTLLSTPLPTQSTTKTTYSDTSHPREPDDVCGRTAIATSGSPPLFAACTSAVEGLSRGGGAPYPYICSRFRSTSLTFSLPLSSLSTPLSLKCSLSLSLSFSLSP